MKLIQIFLTLTVTISSSGAFAYATSPSDICLNSMLDRSIWILGVNKGKALIPIKELISGSHSLSHRLNVLQRNVPKSSFSWENALYPVASLQTYSAVEPASRNILSYKSNPDVRLRDEYFDLLQNPLNPLNRGLGTFERAAFIKVCSEINFFDALRCQQAAENLYRNASPLISTDLTYPLVWKQLGNQSMRDGIIASAKRVIEQRKKDTITDFNLLDTLKKGFLSVNMTSEQAEDSAWTVISMIANGAQNISKRSALVIDDGAIHDALTVLSYSMGEFDFNNYNLMSFSYSFPQEVTGRCQTTKAYHFWMAAYQVRDLMRQNFSARESIIAVLSYAKAYHTQGVGTRKGLASVFEKPWNHPTISVMRHDLILNILGAYYGAGLLTGKKINIESIFQKVFAARNKKVGDLDFATEAQKKAKSPIEAYDYWSEMLDPNGIYQIVNQSVGR